MGSHRRAGFVFEPERHSRGYIELAGEVPATVVDRCCRLTVLGKLGRPDVAIDLGARFLVEDIDGDLDGVEPREDAGRDGAEAAAGGPADRASIEIFSRVGHDDDGFEVPADHDAGAATLIS